MGSGFLSFNGGVDRKTMLKATQRLLAALRDQDPTVVVVNVGSLTPIPVLVTPIPVLGSLTPIPVLRTGHAKAVGDPAKTNEPGLSRREDASSGVQKSTNGRSGS